MHLDPLVIAIGRTARIADEALLAAGRRQNHADGIEIAQLANLRIDQNRGNCGDRCNLFPQQETRHIEIVDGHVAEDAA